MLLILYLGKSCSYPMERQWKILRQVPSWFLGACRHVHQQRSCSWALRAEGWSLHTEDPHIKMQTYCSTICQVCKHHHPPTSHICASAWLRWLGSACWSNFTSSWVLFIFSIHRPKCVFGCCKFVLKRREMLTSRSSHFIVTCTTATQARFLKSKLSMREMWPHLHSQLTTNFHQCLASLVTFVSQILLLEVTAERSELLFG